MRWLWLALVAPYLCGCYAIIAEEHRKDAQREMAQYVGHDVSNIMARLGAPSRQFDMPNGYRLYQWDMYGATHATAGGGRYYAGASAWQESCHVRVTTEENAKVATVAVTGDGC